MAILNKNSFLAGTSVYLLSNILNGVIPFILLPVLTRYLNPVEYGEVAIFQTLLGALSAFVGAVFVGAANRKFYDDVKREEFAEFIGSCIQLIAISTLIVFSVLYSFEYQFSNWLSLEPQFIYFAVITASSLAIVNIRLGQWQVQKQALKFGVMQISQSFLNMMLSLLFVVVLLQGAQGRINAQVIAAVFFLFISLLLLNRDKLLKIFIWRKKYLSEALRFGVPLMPHLAGGFLLTSVDRFIINHEIGLAEAGIYMVAVQLTAALGIIFDAINKAYVPWLFEKLKADEHAVKKRIVKLTYLWFCVIFIGVGLSFVIGPFIVIFIAGDKYRQAGSVVGWLVMGQGFQGMYLMVTNYIFYSKRTGLLSLASISSGLINLVLLIVFIPFLGLEGAAIAFAISMCIRFISTWWIAHIRHPMPWFNFHLKV